PQLGIVPQHCQTQTHTQTKTDTTHTDTHRTAVPGSWESAAQPLARSVDGCHLLRAQFPAGTCAWPSCGSAPHHVPVKHIVIGEALPVGVIRFVIETQGTTEVQVGGKLRVSTSNLSLALPPSLAESGPNDPDCSAPRVVPPMQVKHG
uniref:Uncharacterized protein n=1 Tax=Callorhinchus milii TaxID=7868 RepID=A0A4W3HEY0_CALMI